MSDIEEFTDALLRAYVAAMFRREMPDGLWEKIGSDYRHQAPLVLAVASVALERAAEVADDADDDMPFAHETGEYIRGHIAGTSAAARAIRALTVPSPTTAPCPPQAPETGPASPADGRTERT